MVVHSTRRSLRPRSSPLSFGITPRIAGGDIKFTLDRPRNLTIEINGSPDKALHLFANPLEEAPPKPGDPGVIYFGPGVHEVTTMTVASGATVYLAGGAVLRVAVGKDEKPTTLKDWSGVKNYRKFMGVRGKGITIRGRGVIDMSPLPWHARSGIVMEGAEGVRIEGITILGRPGLGRGDVQRARYPDR